MLPLSRFTVLDLTRVRSGPTCVRQLADWGANVIKIEAPEEIDTGSGMGGDRHGPDFQHVHRNKRGITLNLKHPDGLAVFKQMVAKADVVVENYRPDVKDRLGINYDALAAINPRHRAGLDQRLRPDRALCEAAGVRPDRPGDGRADERDRPARPGPGAGRHPRRRPDRRALHRHRHPGGAAGARADRAKAAGCTPRCWRRWWR